MHNQLSSNFLSLQLMPPSALSHILCLGEIHQTNSDNTGIQMPPTDVAGEVFTHQRTSVKTHFFSFNNNNYLIK